MTADRSALAIAAAVRAGEETAEAIVEAAFARIAKHDGAINALTARHAGTARAAARAIDAAVRRGENPGPLAGAPFVVKNLFDVAGETTLAGAKLRETAPAAAEDAFAVAQLRKAGAVLIGAANMDEFAYGFTTENAHFGPTRNPHDRARVAGGSSGGSAAAVAAGYAPIALGSDTNGSVRVPAALCGVFGLKPTFSRLSRRGVYPFVHSLDHVGHFARTARDLAATYDALQGRDPLDPAQAERPIEAASGLAPGTWRVGILSGYFEETASPEARAAVAEAAHALGARDGVALPEAPIARAAAFCLTAAEGGALHLAQLRTRYSDYDPATRDRLIAGAMLPAGLALRAQRVRRWFRDKVAALFERFDLLLAPATPFSAPPIGQAMVEFAGKPVLARASLGLYAQPLSFIGLPIAAVPVVEAGKLPLGVQIIGPAWAEARVLAAAHALEMAGVCRAAAPSALLR